MSTQKNSTCIVAHDAGGAHIVAVYARKHLKNPIAIAFGPAIDVFRLHGFTPALIKTDDRSLHRFFAAHPEIKRVIAGTSFPTKHELHVLAAARSRGIHSISYLDHWVRYRERFGYPKPSWHKALPDEIWVGDRAAFTIARRQCAGVPVKLVPNEYLKAIISKIRKQKKSKSRAPSILFLSDPLSQARVLFHDGRTASLDEFGVLAQILESVKTANRKTRIVVRLHPREKIDKYSKLLADFGRNVIISLPSVVPLERDLAQADLVVGTEGMAMAIAYSGGKKTLCIVPRSMKKTLPFPLATVQTLTQLDVSIKKFLKH